MNRCPHCGETLQEGAHFCPYCMTSLDNKTVITTRIPKHNRRLLAVSAVLLLVLCAVGIALLFGQGDDPVVPADTPTTAAETVTTTVPSIQNGDNAVAPSSGETTTRTVGATSSTSAVTTSTATAGKTENSRSSSATVTTAVPTTTAAPQAITYTCVTATEENAYPPGKAPYSMPSDCVVITGVSGIAANGVYNIPTEIDGQPVMAIMPSAFANVSAHVKTVILPASVHTVWSDAFVGCYNLTDLYFCAETIGIYENAFPAVAQRNGTLTLHGAYNSHDFEFYYYRNIADDYGAQWAQWNG